MNRVAEIESPVGVEGFVDLPQTRQTLAEELPKILKERLKPHLYLIRERYKFLLAGNPTLERVSGITYLVEKETQTGTKFSFDMQERQGEVRKEHFVLQTDDSRSRVEYLECMSTMDGVGNVPQQIWTQIDLRMGRAIYQYVDFMAAGNRECTRSSFGLNTLKGEAELVWTIEGEEQMIMKVTSEEERVPSETRQKLKKKERMVVTPAGHFYLPEPDNFLTTAIMQAANLQPIQLRSVVH